MPALNPMNKGCKSEREGNEALFDFPGQSRPIYLRGPARRVKKEKYSAATTYTGLKPNAMSFKTTKQDRSHSTIQLLTPLSPPSSLPPTSPKCRAAEKRARERQKSQEGKLKTIALPSKPFPPTRLPQANPNPCAFSNAMLNLSLSMSRSLYSGNNSVP